MTVWITLEAEMRIPQTPNFILTKRGDPVPVEEFSEQELRVIGAAWTRMLLEKRARRLAAVEPGERKESE